jgi:hypothetical protein
LYLDKEADSPASLYKEPGMYAYKVRYKHGLVDADGSDYSARHLLPFAEKFYSLVALGMLTNNLEKTRADIKPIADELATALSLSCFGEARYELDSIVDEIRKRCPGWYYKTTTLGSLLLSYGKKGSDGRDGFVEAGNYTPQRMAALAKHTLVMSLRILTHGNNAYAGPLWAYGAYLADAYWRGKLPAILFVDQVFNLVHNGGGILTKVYSYSGLNFFLNQRRQETPEKLTHYVSSDVCEEYGYTPSADPPSTTKFLYLGALRASVNKTAARKALGLKKWVRKSVYTSHFGHDYVLAVRPKMSAANKKLGRVATKQFRTRKGAWAGYVSVAERKALT